MLAIVGREEELDIFSKVLDSDQAEFLAVHGRRRVGKTFLIRSFFENSNVIFFEVTGTKKGSLRTQISHFTKQMSRVFYKGAKLAAGKNWDETFEILTHAFEIVDKHEKIVLFMDEFPWMATKNSRLLENLDYYWNQHWSRDKRIKLIICGSSASWIIEKVVNNKGGLHNRLTHNIHLDPFNLYETQQYLKNSGINLSHKHILQIFMVTGGVPYYLSKVKKGYSATQNIENLAFKKKGFLLEEFDNLFSSIFENADLYIEIIRTIAQYRYGIGQEELLKKLGKAYQGKGGMEKLKALQDANFIISFIPYFHEKKGIYYKVIDPYTVFYFYWIEPVKNTLLKKGLTKGYWEKCQVTAAWHSWSGYTFESLCYEHLPQISTALKLSPTAIPTTWRYVPKKGDGAQIDLLFDRDDDAITVCEIKYTDQPFSLDKGYAEKMNRKIDIFKNKTKTTKHIFLALISANGIKTTLYSQEMVASVVILEDLFKKI